MQLILAFAFVALASASYGPSGQTHSYHGKYGGKCQYDGLYYKDAKSFVICSNGIAYDQYCAPGSRNSGYSKFSYGSSYSHRDFCDVNLVDQGYTVKHAPKKVSYAPKKDSYAPKSSYQTYDYKPAYQPVHKPAYKPVHKPEYKPVHKPVHQTSYNYHGKYAGKCEYDGLYFNNEYSFVFCSNGNSYVQKCAPGTKNSAYTKFSYGNSYSHRDFCDVNLVDSGYGVNHAPKHKAPKYVAPKYEAPKYVAPKYEAPKYAAPKYEAPKYVAPKYEAPKYVAPKYEAPKYVAPKYEDPKYVAPRYDAPKYDAPSSYNGKYSGKCGKDGLYYNNEKSFIFCSNGSSYVQACAPGTRNSGYDKYSQGHSYTYRDFCDVNLVDAGYGVKAAYH